MLTALLDPARWDVQMLGAESLTSDVLAAAENGPAVVCVGSLPPGGLAHSRYLCKRLRARFPGVKIVVGRWGLKGDAEQNREQLREAGRPGGDDVGGHARPVEHLAAHPGRRTVSGLGEWGGTTAGGCGLTAACRGALAEKPLLAQTAASRAASRTSARNGSSGPSGTARVARR